MGLVTWRDHRIKYLCHLLPFTETRRSSCNVDGNILQLAAGKLNGSDPFGGDILNFVQVDPRNENIDLRPVLSSDDGGAAPQRASFAYLNTNTSHLIAFDPFQQLNTVKANTESPSGGEIYFTKDSAERPIYYPSFGFDQQGYLTADGKSDAFTHCTNGSEPFGSIAIGPVEGKKCESLTYILANHIGEPPY